MRLRALIIKEFRQFRRDRRMVFVSLVAPLIQLTLLGFAANLDVRDLPVAICDQDHSLQSRRLIAEIAYSGYFRVQELPRRAEDLPGLLDRSVAQLALQIPAGFSRDLRAGGATVQVLVDGSDANSAGIGAGYLAGILAEHGARYQARQYRGRAAGGGLEARTRVLYNPALESRLFMVPGVLGLVLFIMTGMLTALSIVKEREIGTLEQVMVTPLGAGELLLGKLVPYLLVGAVDLALVLAVMILGFHVPLRGSLAFLLVCAFLFVLSCLGLGLLTSAVSSTQQQALMTMYLIMFPSVMLAGFMFPIANMPVWMQYMTYAFPLRYWLQIIRGVMLKGAGPAELWPQVGALVVMSLALFVAGALSFRKRLG